MVLTACSQAAKNEHRNKQISERLEEGRMVIGDEADAPSALSAKQGVLQTQMRRAMSQPACASRSGSERGLARVWSCPSISLRSCPEEENGHAQQPVKQQSLDSALKDAERQKQVSNLNVD